MTDLQVLEQYFAHCHRREYRANSTIITAGAHSSSLYYIVSGSVSVVINDDEGHEFLLAYLNDGDFFGEIGLFDERHERSAWVRARTDCEIAQLRYDQLSSLASSQPEVVFAMLSSLSLRVRDTSRKVRDLAFKDVSGRIARALLDLCEQPGAEPGQSGITVSVTRQELGKIVGCSREMASRVMRILEEQGLVKSAGRKVLVIGKDRDPGHGAPLADLDR